MDGTKHQKVITKIRVYLVENLDLENTTIFDRLLQEGVLSQIQYNAIKEKCSTNKNKASALLDHLYNRPEEEWDTFLRSLSQENQQHIVDKCLETAYEKPTVYLLCTNKEDFQMKAVIEEMESTVKFVDKTIRTQILMEQEFQDKKVQEDIQNCGRKKFIRVIPYTKKADIECPEQYNEDTCCVVFIPPELVGNDVDEYQQYMNHSGCTCFLSSQLMETWDCHLDSSHSDKFFVYVPCNVKFDESYFIPKKLAGPVRIVVDMPTSGNVNENLNQIMPVLENFILKGRAEVKFKILFSSLECHQKAIAFRKRRGHETTEIEFLLCTRKAEINALKKNSLWIIPGGGEYLTWTSMLPSTHGIPQIITTDSHLCKIYQLAKARLNPGESDPDVRDIEMLLKPIQWGCEAGGRNLEACLMTQLDNYGESIERARCISKWFLCNGSVIKSTSRFLKFALGGTLAEIHIRVVGQIEKRSGDIIVCLQRALIAEAGSRLDRLVKEAWGKYLSLPVVDVSNGSIIMHVYVADLKSMESLQRSFRRGNIGEAVLETLLLIWKSHLEKTPMSDVSLEVKLVAPPALRPKFQDERIVSSMNTWEKDGRDISSRAAFAGATDILFHLVSEGHLKQNEPASSTTLLLEACSAGHLEVVQLLLENCEDLDESHMMEAAALAQGHPNIGKFLEMKTKRGRDLLDYVPAVGAVKDLAEFKPYDDGDTGRAVEKKILRGKSLQKDVFVVKKGHHVITENVLKLIKKIIDKFLSNSNLPMMGELLAKLEGTSVFAAYTHPVDSKTRHLIREVIVYHGSLKRQDQNAEKYGGEKEKLVNTTLEYMGKLSCGDETYDDYIRFIRCVDIMKKTRTYVNQEALEKYLELDKGRRVKLYNHAVDKVAGIFDTLKWDVKRWVQELNDAAVKIHHKNIPS